MKKNIYKVPLYRVYPMSEGISEEGWGSVEYLDDIIVKKTDYKVKEVITKYTNISLDDTYTENKLHYTIIPENKKDSIYLLVFKKDFIDANLVNQEELDNYINNFKESNFKKTYDEIKELEKNKNDFKGMFSSFRKK